MTIDPALDPCCGLCSDHDPCTCDCHFATLADLDRQTIEDSHDPSLLRDAIAELQDARDRALRVAIAHANRAEMDRGRLRGAFLINRGVTAESTLIGLERFECSRCRGKCGNIAHYVESLPAFQEALADTES